MIGFSFRRGWALAPWDEDFSDLFRTSAFRGDVSAVAKSSRTELENTISALDAASGFLGPEAIQRTVQGIIDNPERARGVASFVFNMLALQRQQGEGFLEKFKKGFDGADLELEHTQKQLVSDLLGGLVRKRPAADRHGKADDLASRIGAPLHNFTITCDLRPVFDEKRESVEGMFPVAILTVETHASLLPETVTVRLSAKQLEKIVKEATNAQKKVTALRAMLAAKGIQVPEAGVQAPSEDEDKDETDA